ncbi:MAG: PAS domain-containing protein, partial [Methylotenera sp.]|nr:PAS domain-containing protein [Methylotenera sp.]
MKNNLISRLQSMNKWHLRLASVILSILLTLLIVAIMQQMLEGKITTNFMLTGLVAAIVVAFIISSFLQLLMRLNQDNNHLNAIIMSCPVPIALYDNKQQILRLNPEFTKIFGYTIEDIPTLTDWWLKAYPEADYRQWVIDSWHARLQLSKLNNAAFEPLEVNIHCKNKMVKTIMTTVTPLDAIFKGLYIVVLYDVSERKQIETELRIAATAFESQEGMIITDANSKIL